MADHRELATGSDWDGLQPERDCCRLSDTQAARPGTAVTPRPGATRDFEQLRFGTGLCGLPSEPMAHGMGPRKTDSLFEPDLADSEKVGAARDLAIVIARARRLRARGSLAAALDSSREAT